MVSVYFVQGAKMRTGTILLLGLMACGAEETSAPLPSADPAASPSSSVSARSVSAKSLDVGCPSKLVGQFKKLVAGGCQFSDVPDAISLVPQVLRNVPYAARGHKFKNRDLSAFFLSESAGCPTPWYRPDETAKVVLPADEMSCVRKLKKHEKSLREQRFVPPAMESYILKNHTGALVEEIDRHIGQPHLGDRIYVDTEPDKTWSLHFYREAIHDGMKTEHSTIIRCDAKGACQTMHAG